MSAHGPAPLDTGPMPQAAPQERPTAQATSVPLCPRVARSPHNVNGIARTWPVASEAVRFGSDFSATRSPLLHQLSPSVSSYSDTLMLFTMYVDGETVWPRIEIASVWVPRP